MPVGRYQVRAQKIGYSTARDSVTIIAGQVATLNFKLERSPIALEAVSAVGSRGAVRSVKLFTGACSGGATSHRPAWSAPSLNGNALSQTSSLNA